MGSRGHRHPLRQSGVPTMALSRSHGAGIMHSIAGAAVVRHTTTHSGNVEQLQRSKAEDPNAAFEPAETIRATCCAVVSTPACTSADEMSLSLVGSVLPSSARTAGF